MSREKCLVAEAESNELILSVSEFVALLNQTLEFAYPAVILTGELANLRVSKGKWLYFDLKDELASVKFFGTVYHLPGPLEDGLLLKVRGTPRLHPLYGFSVNVQSIQPAGEGSIRKAAELLQAKLAAEGLFELTRKRALPYPPARIGLITSKQSAAYADFIKIMNARWHGVAIELIDVQVQGEVSPAQIIAALAQFNALAEPPEVLVLIRGGGSAEDLAAFSTEQVTRAVAASRVPTLVAIGHEIDLSLAELAADQRASTPSNAAELLVPDRREAQRLLADRLLQLEQFGRQRLKQERLTLQTAGDLLQQQIEAILKQRQKSLQTHHQLLMALSPESVLRRGYAIVRSQGQVVRSGRALAAGAILDVEMSDADFIASVQQVNLKRKGKRSGQN